MSAAQVSELGPRTRWYRDPVSCLQSTLATLLIEAGEEPLSVLGLGWEFGFIPGDVEPTEFYWPCRRSGDLVGSVLAHHQASSRWRTAPADDPLGALEQALSQGRLPIIAVDNYYLPFRPAFGDVHAAHLIVVHEVDRADQTVIVSDAMPPAFEGRLPVADLLRSWRSSNPRDAESELFSGSGIEARWLDVQLGTPFPTLDADRLRTALTANLLWFEADDPADPGDPRRTGSAGLRFFTDDLVARARAGEADALAEAYAFGWGPQAQAALHGELLRHCGSRWQVPELAEAGRRVETVAHTWTALRVTSAHGRRDPGTVAAQLVRHGAALNRAYLRALESMGQAVDSL
jgi:hypothetical protein